jgi:hypothetical protein
VTERGEDDRLRERPPRLFGVGCLGGELVVGVRQPRDLRLREHAHLGLDEARTVDARDGIAAHQAPDDSAPEHHVQE